LGHKLKGKDPFQRDKDPARVNKAIALSERQSMIPMHGSAICNGWENAQTRV